jgi:hypothetical protein
MTDLENELRGLLRPLDAPQGFADRVMRALPVESKPVLVSRSTGRKPAMARLRQFGVPTALAASLLVAVLLGQRAAVERELRAEQQGREASRELMQALRLTSQKLDIAYQALESPPRAAAEENRS